jgi:hypothetical protein
MARTRGGSGVAGREGPCELKRGPWGTRTRRPSDRTPSYWKPPYSARPRPPARSCLLLLAAAPQAFALAPLFVWYELLFLLGYRPSLRAALQARVEQVCADLDARGRGARSAGGGDGAAGGAREPLLGDRAAAAKG